MSKSTGLKRIDEMFESLPYDRKVKMTAYKLAKEANDPEWDLLTEYSNLRRKSINNIMKKYGKQARKIIKELYKNDDYE